MPKIRTHDLVLKNTMRPNVKYKRKGTYNQFRFAHQSVNKKKTAITIDATLLAFVSNPHAINEAPIKDEPR